MQTLNLAVSASVVLDGDGNGTASAGPSLPGESWQPAVVSVGANSNTNEATCRIYIGSLISPGTFVDGTYSGSSGDSTDRATQTLFPGQFVYAQWVGGDPGAVATMNIQGQRSVP